MRMRGMMPVNVPRYTVCPAPGPAVGTWRSLVARSVRDAEVAGSNPAVPTRRPGTSPGLPPSGGPLRFLRLLREQVVEGLLRLLLPHEFVELRAGRFGRVVGCVEHFL